MAKTAALVKSSNKVIEGEVVHTIGQVNFGKLKSGLPATNKYQELSVEQANRNVEIIRKTGLKTKELAHITAVGILLHYVNHGDYSALIRLHSAVNEALGTAMSNKLIAWVEKFSTLRWKETKVAKESHYIDSVKGQGMKEKRFDLSATDPKTGEDVGAAGTPFYTMTAPGGATNLVYEMKLVAALYERLSNAVRAKTEDNVKHIVSTTFLTDLRDFLEHHGFSFDEKGKPVVPEAKAIPYYKAEKARATLIKGKKAKRTRAAKPKAPVAEATGEASQEAPTAH